MRYKIGELSKILNIPIDTLRYFEKQGIIHPIIDENNSYRYYDAWDVNYLLEYTLYRKLEFSQSEVFEMQRKDSLEEFIQRFENRLEYFKERKRYYNDMEEMAKQKLCNTIAISEQLDQISIRKMEVMDYFIHRHNYEYDSAADTDGLFDEWMSYQPFTIAIMRINKEDLMQRNNVYEWGFGMATHWVNHFQLKNSPRIEHIPGCDAVYTVVKTGGKGTFTHNLLDPALAYIEKHQLRITGSVFGSILARTHEPEGYSRFFEFYIPIE